MPAPAHWSVDRIKWSISGLIGGTWGDEPNGVDDLVCVRVADFDRNRFTVVDAPPTLRAIDEKERGRRLLSQGDLLIEKSGGGDNQPVGYVVEFGHTFAAVCSNFIARLPIATGMWPRYWAYVHASLYSGRLNIPAIKQTTGIQNLDTEAYFNQRVPFPPLPEQRAIAKYLDCETARLDALVEAKERVLWLLAEKRRALITRAVTRGLDPRAALHDSGIPWLGEIPAHWRVMRVGLAGHILMGRQRAPRYEKGSHMTPYLRVANVFDGFVDYSDVLEMNFEPEEQALFGLLPGDILLNEGQSRELVGRSAVYRASPHKYCFQNTLIRFRCGEGLNPEFAQAQFASWLQAGVFQVFCRQSTNIAHLGADRLAQIHMVLPPPNEQQAIIEHIERETIKLDNMGAATKRTIALLQERRAALIAAAVTGQIAVDGAA
jgi:type I restriction enzyme, S subunit